MFATTQQRRTLPMLTDGYDTDEMMLLAKLAKGDEQAFTQLYHNYSNRLYSNILRFVKCEETAKEILQDLFLKIWELREKLDPNKSFKSFLFKVAENLVYDHFRKAARDKRLGDHLIASAVSFYSDTEEMVIYQESFHLVQKAIDQLPPTRKLVFTLCKIEGKSYDEIAALLGISISTISDHIVKANRTLKVYLHHNADIAISLTIALLIF